MASDWSMDVDGMRTDDRFRFCSSSVGRNSRPRKKKVTTAAANTATAAPMNGQGLATERRSHGS